MSVDDVSLYQKELGIEWKHSLVCLEGKGDCNIVATYLTLWKGWVAAEDWKALIRKTMSDPQEAKDKEQIVAAQVLVDFKVSPFGEML